MAGERAWSEPCLRGAVGTPNPAGKRGLEPFGAGGWRSGARGFMGLRAGPLRPSPWLSPAAARMVRPSPFPPCSVKALTFVHLLGASSRNTPQWGTAPLHRTEKQVTNKSPQRVTILRVMKVQEGHVMVTCREVVLGLPRTGHLSQDPKDEGVGKWARCAKVLRP